MDEKTYNLAKICEPAVSQLALFCSTYGLSDLVKADIVCIKCSSRGIYEARRLFYDVEGRFLYQSIVSGRRIAIVGLKETIKTSVGDIHYLEIADQKPDNSQTDRLDHIGIVPVGISYDELIAKLEGEGADIKELVRANGYRAHDVILPTGFIIRIEHTALLDKIKIEEMV